MEGKRIFLQEFSDMRTGYIGLRDSCFDRAGSATFADDFYHTDSVLAVTRWLYCVKCQQCSIRLEVLGYLCASYLLRAFERPKIQGLMSRDSIVDRQFVTALVRE